MNIKYSSTKTNKTTTNYCSEKKILNLRGGQYFSMGGPLMRGGSPHPPHSEKHWWWRAGVSCDHLVPAQTTVLVVLLSGFWWLLGCDN